MITAEIVVRGNTLCTVSRGNTLLTEYMTWFTSVIDEVTTVTTVGPTLYMILRMPIISNRNSLDRRDVVSCQI